MLVSVALPPFYVADLTQLGNSTHKTQTEPSRASKWSEPEGMFTHRNAPVQQHSFIPACPSLVHTSLRCDCNHITCPSFQEEAPALPILTCKASFHWISSDYTRCSKIAGIWRSACRLQSRVHQPITVPQLNSMNRPAQFRHPLLAPIPPNQPPPPPHTHNSLHSLTKSESSMTELGVLWQDGVTCHSINREYLVLH